MISGVRWLPAIQHGSALCFHAGLAAQDVAREPHVGEDPDEDVGHDKHRYRHQGREGDVGESYRRRVEHDGDHGCLLSESGVEELVVDVVAVGHEGFAAVADAVEVDAHHVEARHDERGEGEHERVGQVRVGERHE